MKTIVVIVCLSFFPAIAAGQDSPRVLLAVFAHPDDETFAGPVLARYAREGAKVYLAIATKGEKGANERAAIPAGDALAKVRRGEATCACQQLGIEPPILFDLNDGELGAIANPLGKNVQSVADHVAQLIEKYHPQVVVTWGPEGGYGHPDHRLVSDAVTQAIQSSKPSPKLFYAGLSISQVKPLDSVFTGGFAWHPMHADYLTARVQVTKADLVAYHNALECHKSQFSADEMHNLEKALDAAWEQGVWFRPWFGNQESNDLFK